MALLPLPGVSHSDGHVIFKVLSSPDKYSLTKNRGLFPYIQEVGKRVRKAEISTLIEICAIMGSRTRGGADMNIKLTIPERLKDLRTERNLTLEQLSEGNRHFSRRPWQV